QTDSGHESDEKMHSKLSQANIILQKVYIVSIVTTTLRLISTYLLSMRLFNYIHMLELIYLDLS
ncbi:hypothetical protein, partial [Mycobacterium tuberculosis]